MKLCQPYSFEFGDIAAENLSRTLDEVQLTLDDKGRGEVSTESQWKETHSPLQVIFEVVCWNRAVAR